MIKHSLVAALLTASMSTAFADTATDTNKRNGVYGGATLGFMNVDVSGVDALVNAGVQVGVHVNDGLAFEAQYTNTIAGGEYSVNYGYGSYAYEVEIQTLAAYAVYRSPGQIYFKGRGGFIHETVGSASDTGISAGVGIGFKAGDSAAIELEATLIEQDVSFISASINFGF